MATKTELGEDPEVRKSQDQLLERQKKFLDPMEDGNHAFLDNLYKHEYYDYTEQDSAALLAMGRKR